MFVFRSIAEDPRVEVSGLVVDEKRRSQGIGEKLLERAEQWAREKGCRAVGLRCNVIREPCARLLLATMVMWTRKRRNLFGNSWMREREDLAFSEFFSRQD